MLPPDSMIAGALKAEPLQAIDVGASNGIPEHWKPFSQWMEVQAIEPNRENCEEMAKSAPGNVHWHPVGLAATSGKHNLYVLNAPTGSSLYPPSPLLYQYTADSYAALKEIVPVDCLSFSDFLIQNQCALPHLIKLDTQGSELDILQSLQPSQWADMLCVQAEVEFRPLYEGQPLFEEVNSFMTSKGFRLVDLHTSRSYHSRPDRMDYYVKNKLNMAFGSPKVGAELVAGEALYFREFDDGSFFKTKEQLIRFLAIAIIYTYFDTALWILDQDWAKALLTSEELETLEAEVLAAAPKPKIIEKQSRSGRRLRKWLGNPRFDLYQAFWTKVKWPNQ